MIIFKIPIYFYIFFAFFNLTAHNAGMHIAKLTAVTFVKYQYNMFVAYRMLRIFGNKNIQLLNRSNNNPRIVIFQLLFQHGSIFIAISSTFFKTVILFNCLIIKVFSVYHKQYLINIR